MASRFSRRRLLVGLGVLGGAGAVLGAMEALDLVPRATTAPYVPPSPSDFALQGRDGAPTVLVLGAGVAGLAAAYELEKAGYHCELIEARDRPGGRNWTVRGGDRATDLDGVEQTAAFAEGMHFDAGPARIPQHHVTLDYCRELGVPVELFVNDNPDAYVFHEPRPQAAAGPLAGTRVRQRAVRADLLGSVAELLARATDAGALDADLGAGDREALITFLQELGALSDRRYIGSDRRGYREAPGAGEATGAVDPPYALPDMLAAGLGFPLTFPLAWDQSMPMFHPVGGMDRLPHALAGALRGTIHYATHVRAITDTGEQVEVVVEDADGERSLSADYCVCALPPPALNGIATSFPPAVTQVLGSLTTLAATKVGLQYRRRFWETEDRILGGITWTNMDIGTIWYPSEGYLGERGLVVGAYNFADDAAAFARMSPQERHDHAVAQGVKVHGPAYRDELEAAFSVAWSREPFSEGGWVLWPERGAGYRRLLEPIGRVFLAGDHLSQVTAWQHGALESARAAVTALHERALSED
jgi:monoamine oxidase